MTNVVLITGAGGGLGRALAMHFHASAWYVIPTDVRSESLEGYRDTERYFPVTMDVSSDLSVRDAFEQVRKRFTEIRLIIGNAGIDRYFPLSEAPVEHFRQVFEVNLFGVYRVNQIFLPLLKKPGGGIMAIGSESLHIKMPFLTYPITKRAMENYMLALRQELWFSGCWAAVVRCGPVRTALAENVFHLKNDVPGTCLDPVFERFAASAPKEVGRMMDPSEVARRIYRIATGKKHKGVHRINNRLTLRMLQWLPFSLVEMAVRKRLRPSET